MGIIGGIIGGLSAKGNAPRPVMGLTWFLLIFGGVCTITGIVAAATHQWWVKYVPALYLGLMLIFVAGSIVPGLRRRYQELELRRMSAQDSGG